MAEKPDQVSQLIERVARLTDCLELLAPKIDTLLKHITPRSHTSPLPNLPLLPEKQRRICDEITRVSGTDSIAMLKVEQLLRELKGDKISEAFGRFLGQLFRERSWGVRCSCGEIGKPMWQANSRCAEGGLLVIAHKTDSKQKIHDSTTTFREHTIISRPDRRRSVKQN